jgi:orotate phosphoribosyltransferase
MDLIKYLKSKNVLKFGEFTLRSGTKTHYYCDIKEALGDPELLDLLTKGLIKLVPKNTTCIAGSGYGGITLASLVSYKLKLPLVLVRDKIKNHGTKKLIDGYVPIAKDRVCIVDDVFTTGSSIRETKKKLMKTKTKITKAIVVLNRSNKKEVLSLLDDRDLVINLV